MAIETETYRTLIFSRALDIDDDELSEAWLIYKFGRWTLETRERKRGVVSSVHLSTAAMDALVAAWPGFRRDALA